MRNFAMQPAFLIAAAVLLMGADAAWKSKPADKWTEEDARQILARSPWVKVNSATITRRLTEDQLREGGQMGQPRGFGNEGIDANVRGEKVSPNVFTGPGGDDRSPRSLPRPMTLQVRWESALPVRLAEIKTHEVEPPTLEGDGYQIAVYGIPEGDFKGDPKDLGKPLKSLAALEARRQKGCAAGQRGSVPARKRRGGGVSVSFVGGNRQARRADPIRGANRPDCCCPNIRPE